jgi:hypothetical protein
VQVVGINPHEKMSYLDTPTLRQNLMGSMHVTENADLYEKHLALLVQKLCVFSFV